MEKGDVIRFTRFATLGFRASNRHIAQPAAPLWGVVMRVDDDLEQEGDVRLLCGGVHTLPGDFDTSFEFNGTYDTWTIPPEDEIPDEVWATLARLRLTGELEL